MNRSLGDLRFLNRYVGIPYLVGGRTPAGLDCYGLCRLVYRAEYGETLPDWLGDSLNIRERAGAIEDQIHSGNWREVEQPEEGDFVVCYRSRAAHHLGLFFGGGVLHAQEGRGVVWEPLARFEERFTQVIYGEWTP